MYVFQETDLHFATCKSCLDSLLSISKYCIQKLAVLMVMLKPNLLKNCFTTTQMHRLSQFSASPAKYAKHIRSQTCLQAVSVIQQFTHAKTEVCWFTSRNTGCSACVCLEISIDLSSRVAKTGSNYLLIKASIAQKLPGRTAHFCKFCSFFCGLSGNI